MSKFSWVHPESVSEACVLQKKAREKRILNGFSGVPDRGVIFGVDASISKKKRYMIGSIVAMRWPGMDVISSAQSVDEIGFPYVPGYLSFREVPVLLKAAEKLSLSPDLVLVDGQGIAHPRRVGLATHLGIVTGWTTIGCAKSRLTGVAEVPSLEKGAQMPLMDGEEQVGVLVRTRKNVKPLWVSPGNGVSIEDAVEWTLKTCSRFRLPEPIRYAHNYASEFRAGFKEED